MQYTSTSIWGRAEHCIAQGALTNSKHKRTHVEGVYPTHVHSGTGCILNAHNGVTYVDYICGLGTNLLGYGHPGVARKAYEASLGGWSHSLPTHWEITCAEKLKEFFPFIDRVKFLKTGSEACSAAVRIARAHTEKRVILSEGYHGYHDQFVSLTPPACGVSDVHHINTLLPNLENLDNRVAAVIIEPVITDNSRERVRWLHALREKCTEVGALLIFDEIITGFRYQKFGVSNCYGVIPDMICLGKAMANGMPLAAVCGKEAWMDNPNYFVSSTYASEVSSLAAAMEVMEILQKDAEYDIKNLYLHGEEFISRFNELGRGKLKLEGYPTRGRFVGEDRLKALFFQECCKVGILFGPSWFFNFPLIKHTDNVLKEVKIILERVFSGKVQLEGKMPSSPFAEGVRNGR